MSITKIAAVTLFVTVTAMVSAEARSRVEEIGFGRELSVQGCAACHKVTTEQKRPEAVPDPDQLDSIAAPSFSAIAAKYAGNDRALRTFILKPHWPMRQQQFLAGDLTAIVAYIHSLRRSKAKW